VAFDIGAAAELVKEPEAVNAAGCPAYADDNASLVHELYSTFQGAVLESEQDRKKKDYHLYLFWPIIENDFFWKCRIWRVLPHPVRAY